MCGRILLSGNDLLPAIRTSTTESAGEAAASDAVGDGPAGLAAGELVGTCCAIAIGRLTAVAKNTANRMVRSPMQPRG